MAKLNNNLSIMVVLLSSMMAASMVVAVSEFTTPPEPEPELDFYKTIEECSKNISDQCGKIIVEAVLEDQDISKQCCVELVHGIGKLCHENILRFYVSLPDMGVSATHVYTRGAQVWNTCAFKAASKI
ncbi:hypothetical protein HRI_003905300 [Hibiscus trionum]|uniref:Prolamin-like domain-containing protein n=1 Tax=Hibiscus trionum TaxID=183268 RepID=A0A9W7ITY4_HIBTR|nr:hypothetical protein HRI_003905300 [Hibiscus trionum]